MPIGLVLTTCRVHLLMTQMALLNVLNNVLLLLMCLITLSVTLTPSRPLPQPSRPHVYLASLHLAYIWRSVAEGSDIDSPDHLVEESSPFSPTLFLPVEALLNRVTEQILINHLVG